MHWTQYSYARTLGRIWQTYLCFLERHESIKNEKQKKKKNMHNGRQFNKFIREIKGLVIIDVHLLPSQCLC